LVAEAVRSETGWEDAQVRIVCGVAETASFVFAPASAVLLARRLHQDAFETWRCEVRSEGKVAASFELGVEVRRPRKSSVQSRRGQVPRTGAA
jgi:hypothetical protein